MHAGSNRLQQFLNLYHVPYSMVGHAPALSSQAAAATMHVPGREMAKAIVLQGHSAPYLAVLPAPYRVDLDRFAKIVGEPVQLASEERIRDLFPDCELGAIPPVGRLYGMETYIDESLTQEKEIVFAAGSQSDAVRMSYVDFEEFAMPQTASFAIKGSRQPQNTLPESRRVH